MYKNLIEKYIMKNNFIKIKLMRFWDIKINTDNSPTILQILKSHEFRISNYFMADYEMKIIIIVKNLQ